MGFINEDVALSGIQIHGVRVTDVAKETLRNVLAIVRDAAPLEPVLSPNGYGWVCAARL